MTDVHEPQPIRVSVPLECHLWQNPVFSAEELRQSMRPVKTYEDESHLRRALLRCAQCGHLYFYEFYEIVDWDEGDDPQYRSWIPVDDEASADALNRLQPMELLQHTGIRADFGRTAKKPSEPRWKT